ncbi:MAG: hypothetical protein A3F18_08300 [Legionellales bacterium RIFCSPHIGHO2_12_FULL_37_14]|nr:MAG: hypothetical protein A3F18_08300 [Legionellales bacterium RIFCSPHIGHO2_12_FULL_37_14]
MAETADTGRLRGIWPPRTGDDTSILKEETSKMERARRLLEQDGLRRATEKRVESKNEDELEVHQELAADEEYQDEMLAHPLLDGQPLDSVEINSITSPRAKEKFNQAQKKQQEQRDLVLSLQPENRLTNTPKFSPKFNPKPGGP